MTGVPGGDVTLHAAITETLAPAQIEAIAADLLDTDALTANHDGTPEWYTVDAVNVEYLVRTVLGFLADRLPVTPWVPDSPPAAPEPRQGT